MVVKVVQPGGVANYSDIAAGVVYAAQKGAKVINISLGGNSDSVTLRTAIASAAQTAVIVAGAGNDNSSTPFYPAAYDDYVLAVAGTTQADTKVGTSNYGAWVDVSAPGENIRTTFAGGGCGNASGTSVAAPFVSGLVGLLRSLHPEWSVNLVRAHIVNTTDNIDNVNPGYEGKLGTGRINANKAVTIVPTPKLSIDTFIVNNAVGGTPAPGNVANLFVTVRNAWGVVTNAIGTLSTNNPYVTVTVASALYGNIESGGMSINTTPFVFAISSSAPHAQAMAFSLTISGTGGVNIVLPLTITTESGIEPIGGLLSSSTVWTSDRIYLVTQNVLVPAGITLTIQPGVIVRFSPGTSLLIGGTLIADGTKSAPLLFTSAQENPLPGDWALIKFTETATDAVVDDDGEYISGSIIRYATVEYGEGVESYGTLPYFSHLTFYRNSGDALRTHYGRSGALVIRDSAFIENGRNGVYMFHIGTQRVIIANNQFLRNGGAGMWLSFYHCDFALTVSSNRMFQNLTGIFLTNPNYGCHEDILIENNIIVNSSGAAYRAGLGLDLDQARPVVRHNIFANHDSTGVSCWGGPCSVIWADDFSAPYLIGNTFVGNRTDTLVCLNCNYGQRESRPLLRNNWDVSANKVNYVFRRGGSTSNITATHNYWGTANTGQISQVIYDYYDDLNPGEVIYQPILTNPDPTAPAYLWKATIIPDPVGIQRATFVLTFSASMDQTTNPTVTFGTTHPYTSYAVLDNAQWVNDYTWNATYDITSLVPRGTYTISVSGARGADGMEIPTDTRFSFVVDYAGQITDQTPPNVPLVIAGGKAGDPSTVEAMWWAIDPDSPIAEYRYAVGSAPGATDIVNWTMTSNNFFTKTGLGLIAGRQYWVAVQARNIGGLWSASGYSAFIAGQPIRKVFLPLVMRRR